MQKNKIKAMAGAFAAFLLLLAFLLFAPSSQQELYIIEENISSNEMTRSRNNADIYKISFALPHGSAGSAWQHIPIYSQNSASLAAHYATRLLMPLESMLEDEETFYFNDSDAALTVYKNSCMLLYESGLTPSVEAEPLGDVAAASLAVEFLASHGLNQRYKEIIVHRMDTTTTVSFAERLDGYSNHAFTNNITLDNAGNILRAEYYFYIYDRMREVKLIDVREAVRRLPSDYAEGTRIDLTKYSIVYVYENSIIQPAYLFEGQMPDGTQFRHYINASDYN